jgi:PAS domain S-box-containing protein
MADSPNHQSEPPQPFFTLSDQFFQDCFENAPDAFIIVGNSGQILLMNEQSEELFGYLRQDIIGQAIDKLIPSRFHQSHSEHLHHYFQHPHKRWMSQGIDLYALRQNGTEFPVEIRLSPIHVMNQIVTLSAIRDITERKQIEAQARESQIKDDFINTAGHELRTPMTSLQLALYVLQRKIKKLANQEDIKQSLDIMFTSISRMNRLIEDMLDSSRISTRRFSTILQSCDVREIIQASVTEYQKNSGRSIHLTELNNPLIGQVDAHRIRQVLDNLLSNAIKYNPQKSSIEVSVEEYQVNNIPWMRCRVHDHGQGIASPHLPHLFDRYYRIEEKNDKEHSQEGLGLGLYISQAIIQSHGGNITAESTIGEGSTFIFEIPLVP